MSRVLRSALFVVPLLSSVLLITAGAQPPAPVGDDAPPTIRLRSRQFVPAVDVNQLAPEGQLTRRPAHQLLQFWTPVTSELLGDLARAGYQPLRYVPDHAVLVRAAPDADPSALPRLRWMGRLEPTDKTSAETRQAIAADAVSTQVVLFHADVSADAQEAAVRQAGGTWARNQHLSREQLLVTAPSTSLDRLASHDDVAWIFPASEALIDGTVELSCPFAAQVAGLSVAEFALFGDGWDGPGLGQADLGFYIAGGAGLNGAEWRPAERALNEWARYAAVRWTGRSRAHEPRSVDIAWVDDCHGYPEDPDVEDPCFGDGVLAHAFLPGAPEPTAGDIHLNRTRFRWKADGASDYRGISVFEVVLHESGHSLGLGHSSDPKSVMYAFLNGTTTLTGDDISAIQSLYQPPPFCDFVVSPSSVETYGGYVFISVTAASGCTWSVESPTASWVRLDEPLTPTSGRGTVRIFVRENPVHAARSTTLTIAGRTVTIEQFPAPCQYTVSSSYPSTLPALGVRDALTVTPNFSDCEWSIRLRSPWILFPWDAGVYRGAATVNYTIPPNLTPYYRLGSITIDSTLVLFGQFGSFDGDGDGMSNSWEVAFGLNPDVNDASGDPDLDGLTNLEEFNRQSHPNARYRAYFAEGAATTFFNTRFAVVPQQAGPQVDALFRFLRPTGEVEPLAMPIPADGRRITVDANLAFGYGRWAEFATEVESAQPLVIDRTMTWNERGYGSHAETAIAAPATTWYLAEGATHSGFQLFYLVLNPNDTPALVRVDYLLPSPAPPIRRTYTVAPRSRFNIWVNTEPGLASTDLSGILTSDIGVIVERAMYLDAPGKTFGAGHESAGVNVPSTSWFLAEGATGAYFDTFVLIANPGTEEAGCDIAYLLGDGTVVARNATVAAMSRHTIWIDAEGGPLADAAVSTTVTCSRPVIVERSMWWPGPTAATWAEAHNSPGSTATGTTWMLAEGEQGGPSATETYVLIANTDNVAGRARVTLLPEFGGPVTQVYTLPPHSRTSVPVGAAIADGGFGTAMQGRRFGTLIESLAPASGGPVPQIVVERAMYSNADNVTWAAGTNALATRIR